VAGFALARSGSLARLAGTDAAAETRAAMLAPLAETARAFLPFGAGFGSFDSVYRRFEPDALLSTIYMNQAHNEPLQLAIEGGAPALLLLAAFGWWWARAAVRTVRARLPEQRVSGIAAASATAILLVSSLVDYPLRTPLLAAVFVLLAMSLDRAARRL
jgi:O-antigen ligase